MSCAGSTPIVCRLVSVGIFLSGCASAGPPDASPEPEVLIELPAPTWDGEVAVERAIRNRRSVRTYQAQPLTLDELSQLLWAAQGIRAGRFRTAPSAGALYPLEVYAAVGNVEGLEAGVYRYDPSSHGLRQVAHGDVRRSLASAAWWQRWVGEGAVALVFSAVYERTKKKYGKRGVRYAHMEVGHASQNVYLQAQALGLGTVVVGGFMDSRVKKVLHMRDDEQPLSIMPVGKPLD